MMLRCLLLPLCLLAVGENDWLSFRGDSRNVAEGDPPVSWADGRNVRWKAPIEGRGPSSPIVLGDRVVVTSSDGARQDRLMVSCFDLEDGKLLWRRSFWATGRTATHPDSANAAPTPASDGQRVFAFYSSNDLACLDRDGRLLWYRGLAHDFPKAGNDVGMAASPVVVEGVVIVQIESQGDAFAAGINAETGQTIWRRPRKRTANWSSPTTLKVGDRWQVLLQSPDGVTAHNPATGEEIWRFEASCDSIASPTTEPGKVYVSTEDGLTLLEVTPDSKAPEVVWQERDLVASPASPVVRGNRIYSLRRQFLSCGDAESGQQLWRKRLAGQYWGTPLLVGDRLYVASKEGKAQVMQLGDSDEAPTDVSVTEMDETIQASPVVVGDALLIRTDDHLWKIAR